MGNCGWIAIGLAVLFGLAAVAAWSGLRLAYAGLKLYLTQKRKVEAAEKAPASARDGLS